MAEYVLAGGVTVEHPANLFARGSILRGVFADLKSPIAYGYDGKDLPVYFNQDPVLNAAAGGGSAASAVADAAAAPARATDRTSRRMRDADSHLAARTRRCTLPTAEAPAARGGRGGRGGGGGGGGRGAGGRGAFARRLPAERPRVVVQFPANADDMLLSGTLAAARRWPTARWRWTCRWARATS